MIAQFVALLLALLVSNGTCAQNSYSGSNAPDGLFIYTCVGPPLSKPQGHPMLPPRVEMGT